MYTHSICVYMYIYICICVYTHTHMHARAYTHTHVLSMNPPGAVCKLSEAAKKETRSVASAAGLPLLLPKATLLAQNVSCPLPGGCWTAF